MPSLGIARGTLKRAAGLQVDDRMKFILSAAAGALGVLVTFIFIPEITSLDLKEGDIRWDLIKKGGSSRSRLHEQSSQQPAGTPLDRRVTASALRRAGC